MHGARLLPMSPQIRHIVVLCGIVVVSLGQHVAGAQDAALPFVQDVWQSDDGLPHNAVNVIRQTQEGYLWLGTAAGLVRFDGVRFVTLTKQGAEPLSIGFIWALYEDRDGTLWVGSGEGLSHITADSVAHFTTQEGLPDNFVRAVVRDNAGDLWVGTYGGGVARYDGQAFTNYGTTEGLPDPFVNTVFKDVSGQIWVGSDTGVSRWVEGRFVQVGQRLEAKVLFEDRNQVLWIGTGDGLYRYQAGADIARVQLPEVTLGSIRALVQDAEGALWIGTESNGLFRHDGQQATRFGTATGLSHDGIRALYSDREGSLWIGTTGGGLNRLKRGRMRVYGLEEGMPSDVVYAIYEAQNGDVWVGTNRGLVRRRNGTIQIYTTTQGLEDERVFAIAEDAQGDIWVGTNGGGVSRLVGQRFVTYTMMDGLPSNVIFGLYPGSDSTLWMSTGNGLSRYQDGQFRMFLASDSLASRLVIAVLEAQDEALWIATNGGLNRWQDNTLTTFTQADGLPGNAIRALYEDADGTLWVGTRGGLARYQDGQFVTLTTREGLPDNVIYAILEDHEQHLWLNSARRGLFRITKADVEAVAQGRRATIRPLGLNRSDGLRSREGEGGFQPAAWKARDGRLWFPTHRGVVVFNPVRMQEAAPAPPVRIEEVLVDDVSVSMAGGTVVMPPQAKRLEIHYTGLSFLDPAQIRFQHRLDGLDDGWRYDGGTARALRVRTFDNLDFGSYTFRVAAANREGYWSEAATLAIEVVPPWWRSRGAYAFYFLLFWTGVFAFVKWRVWALQQQNEALEVLVAERTEQVEAQAEELRALNATQSRFFANLSHEFRTPLTLILGALDELKTTDTPRTQPVVLRGMQHQAYRLLRLINQLLDLSKLDAGNMTLKAQRRDIVAFIEGIAASFAGLASRQHITLDFRATADPVFLAFDADKLEKVLYNLLSNACKFTPDGGKVQVSVAVTDADVTIHVRDTGPGIPEADLPHIFDRFYQVQGGEATLGSGIGLALSRELVQLHGGDLTVVSAPGFGTTFVMSIPKMIVATIKEAAPALPAVPEDVVEAFASWSGDGADVPAAPEDAPLVLIVEDNANVRDYLKQCLGRRYRVVEAVNGVEGLVQAQERVPDLIISDIMMPEMDGLTFCRHLKADERLRIIPVIILTAKVTQENKLEGLEAGADDYLFKPFHATELLIRAENLIEIRKRLRQQFSQEVVVKGTQVVVESADAVFLENVRAVIEANLADTTFSVERLADAVHLSRRQLHRKLSVLTNLSTVGYIRMLRLERAAQLLEQQAGTVSEIAYQVGFQDANYFARLFRQTYDVAPSAYRAHLAESTTDRIA